LHHLSASSVEAVVQDVDVVGAGQAELEVIAMQSF